MTVRLAEDGGMRNVVDLARRMGVADNLQPNLSVSLGAGETTPYRLTAAYAAFVNGGRRVDPYLIEMVQDRDGETIFRDDRRRCRDCGRVFSGQESPRLEGRGTQVIDPITAYQVSSMLEGVIQRGTGASARGLGRWVGGKTGTTNEYRSAWFVGFTPDYIAGVWVGNDKIAAIGVKVRKWVSFHGISLNVEPELDHFTGIVPCGIAEHGVTSLVDLGVPATMDEADEALRVSFGRVFGAVVEGAVPVQVGLAGDRLP
jgi:membrane carboxypeptidase/penicillin-binding protein